MPRVRSNPVRLKRKKQIMKAARGAFGARSKTWKAAKETVERGWRYAYRDRKNKKREFRRLWIMRINAAARLHDMSYSRQRSGGFCRDRRAGSYRAERRVTAGRVCPRLSDPFASSGGSATFASTAAVLFSSPHARMHTVSPRLV
jgi:ribosomal protein L20